MKLRRVPYLLIVILIPIMCFWFFGAAKLKIALKEELAAWQLKAKIENSRYTISHNPNRTPRFTFSEQPKHNAWARVDADTGKVSFSPNVVDEFMRLHDIAHENDMVPQEEQKPGFIIGKQNNIIPDAMPPGSYIINDIGGLGTILVIPQLRLIPHTTSLIPIDNERTKARQKFWDSIKDKP